MLPLLLFLLPIVSAQSTTQPPCSGEVVLVDDFATKEQKFFDNANRWINKLGGDYGTDAASTFDIDTNGRVITVMPLGNDTSSFFFAKYNQNACFDLTKYAAFQFELEAPVGANGAFTLTQMSADCTHRIDDGDSVYLPLSDYYRNDGTRQTVTMPFIDFAKNVKGGDFDMIHLKDWTFVAMEPTNQPFKMYNMRILGGPIGCAIPGVTPRPPPTTTTTASSTPSNTIKDNSKKQDQATSGAYSSKSFFFGLVIGFVPLAAYALL